MKIEFSTADLLILSNIKETDPKKYKTMLEVLSDYQESAMETFNKHLRKLLKEVKK